MFCKLAALLFVLPVALLADDFQLSQKDLVISGSSIGGDVIINGNPQGMGGSGGDLDDPEISTNGTVAFDNGCSFSNEEVNECDGTQRLLKKADKKKLIKRQQLLAKKFKKNKSYRIKKAKIQPKKLRSQRVKNNKKKNFSKAKRNLNPEDECADQYSPCETC